MRFTIKLFQANMAQDVGVTRLIETGDIPADSLAFEWNRAYFCPGCGRVWCRWEKDQIDWVGDNWYAYSRSCPEHQWGRWFGDRPGSMILQPVDILVLPRPVLEAELLSYYPEEECQAS
jgi:hypothetical protein